MLKTKKILLLEDDIVDVMTLKRALKQLNISNELVLKENGEDALSYLGECHDLPGIIFLDINMPKMNGLEFLLELKKNDDWVQIPIVVLTTSKDQQDKLKTFKLGISGYMIKPVSYELFKNMVETIKDFWNFSEHSY